MRIKLFCILLLYLLLYSDVFGQSDRKIEDVQLSGTFKSSMTGFLNQVCKTNEIRIYYKPAWTNSIEVDAEFNNKNLFLLLDELLKDTHIAFTVFQNSIVLVPRSVVKEYSIGNEDVAVLLIGDKLNEGKYRKATISGKILNGKDEEPLPSAVLYNETINEGISTDNKGNFTWELPTGEHNLQVSFIGFEPLNQKIKLIEDGYITFDIFEETHNLDEVVVKGDNNSSSRSQMSLVEVESKMIKELPVLMGEADVIKSVVMMPGIQSIGELSSGFNVRGGNSDQNLVLIDGAPIFNTSHLFGFFSMINPDAVDDVTIYKGGMPASYGERVSAVMDIQLKEGNTEGLKLYGGLGLINSRVTAEGPFRKDKKSSFVVGGRSTYSDWMLKSVKDADFQNSTARFFDVNGSVNLQLGDKNSLKLMGYLSGDEFNLSSNSLYNYKNYIGAINWDDAYGDKLLSRFNASISKYDFELTETSDFGSELSYRLNTGIENVGLKYNLSYIPNNLINYQIGIQGTAYRVNPGKISPVSEVTQIVEDKVQDEQGVEMAAFISGDFDLSDRMAISLGLRYSSYMNLGESRIYLYGAESTKTDGNIVDIQSYDKNEVVKRYNGIEPRVSAKYTLSAESSLRASYQRVNQYLNQISNTSVVSPADFWKVSDYHTKPLIADQLALGYFHNMSDRDIEASAEVYYKKLQNILEYKNGARLVMNHQIEQDLLQAEGYSYGLELLLKKSAGRLNGWLSYSYSRTMRKADNVFQEETINQGDYYPSVYDKPHDLSVIANYQISRRWRVSGNFVLASGRPTTLPELRYKYRGEQIVYFSDRNEYRMPPYHRFDISITLDENLRKKRMWKGSWTLSIYNLYGRNNPYSVYYQRRTAKNIGADLFGLYKFSIIGVPIPSLTYNFKF